MAETPVTTEPLRALRWCERGVAAVAGCALAAAGAWGASLLLRGIDPGGAGWLLFISGLALALFAALLAAGGGAWDKRLRQWLRRPDPAAERRDRLTTLMAAALLLVGATVDLALFAALVDGRASGAPT